ncbi:hypothetical protein GCM10010176_104520 [Nonomuraea spiralis]|nr:hypothetical protein GCM10010176_104520 [Nonomuraea spiralis]
MRVRGSGAAVFCRGINVAQAEALTAVGRMRPAGRAAIETAKTARRRPWHAPFGPADANLRAQL